jgi:hypothetical protein
MGDTSPSEKIFLFLQSPLKDPRKYSQKGLAKSNKEVNDPSLAILILFQEYCGHLSIFPSMVQIP